MGALAPRRASVLIGVAAAAIACVAAPAEASTVLDTRVTTAKAVKRSCATGLLAGKRGVAVRRVRAADTGLVRARLTRPGRTDWDLAIFDARGGLVAASSHWGTREMAEGVTRKGDLLQVQACRRSGKGKRARLNVATVALDRPSGEKVQIVRVSTPTRGAKNALVGAGFDMTEHGGDTFLDVVLHGAADAAKLRKAGFQYKVLVEDLVATDREQRLRELKWAQSKLSGSRRARSASAPGDGTPLEDLRAPVMPSGRLTYRHLWDYTADMKMLVEQNPGLVRPIVFNHPSLEGRPVEGIEIAKDVNADDGRPVFLQTGIHHAREWPSAEMPMEWGFELVRDFGKVERVTDLLSRARVVIVPVVNPDGFNLSREAQVDSQTYVVDPSFAYKRKNCRVTDGALPAPGECGLSANRRLGTDPNRNYGGLWGGPGADAAPAFTSDIYRGAGPFSEPETQNVREFVSQRQVTAFITNHTFSDLILRPPGVKAQGLTFDEAEYKAFGAEMAEQNGYANQHGWELYDTTGTTEDWSYFATAGFGFTFEIGNLEYIGFHPAWPAGVVSEYFGKGEHAGKGNREAYFVALEHAADAAKHSVIAGKARPGATLRLSKSFQTATWPQADGQPILLDDRLETTMQVGEGGRFEWHVNPSTRPAVAKGVAGREVTGPPDGTKTFATNGTPLVPNAGENVPGSYEEHEFDVGPNNGSMTIRIEGWDEEYIASNDLDLFIYRQTDDGTWEQMGSATSDNSQGSYEQTTIDNPPGGRWKIRVENWLSDSSAWHGTATFTQGVSTPGIAPATEAWKLECIWKGKVFAARDVTIARGEQVNVDACSPPKAGGKK